MLAHLQLEFPVDRAGRNKNVEPLIFCGVQRSGHCLDVTMAGAGQPANGCFKAEVTHGLDRFKITVAGSGEPRLDYIYTELIENPCDL